MKSMRMEFRMMVLRVLARVFVGSLLAGPLLTTHLSHGAVPATSPATASSPAPRTARVWMAVRAEDHATALQLTGRAGTTESPSEQAEALRAAGAIHVAVGELTLAASAFESSLLADPGGWAVPAVWHRYEACVEQVGGWNRLVATGHELLGSKALAPPVRAQIAFSVAGALLQLGRDSEAQRMYRDLGYADAWSVIGPFGGVAGSGFDRAFGPEADASPDRTHADESRSERAWRRLPCPDAWMSLDDLYAGNARHVIYGLTFVRSTAKKVQAVELRLGVSGAVKLWVNGRPALAEGESRGLAHDLYAAPASLRPGWNWILLKLDASESSSAGFSLRVTDPRGDPQKDLEWSATPPAGLGPLATTSEGDPPRGRSWLYDAARAHYRTSPNLDAALLMAAMADWVDFEAECLEEFASLADAHDRATLLLDRIAILHQATHQEDAAKAIRHEIRTKNPSVLSGALDLGEESLALDGRRAVLQAFLEKHPASFVARALQVGLLASHDDQPALLAALDKLEALAPEADASVRMRAATRLLGGHGDRMIRDLRAYWERNRRNDGLLELLVQCYVRSNDSRGLIQLCEEQMRSRPNVSTWPELLATLHLRAGELQQAEVHVRRALALAPDSEGALKCAGDVAAARGDRDAALQRYRKVLQNNPDDWQLRERLMEAGVVENPSEHFFVEPTRWLIDRDRARPVDPAEHQYYVLSDCRRVVLPDGASKATFRQVGRVNDAAGVEEMKQQTVRMPENASYGFFEKIVTIKPDGSTRAGESRNTSVSLAELAPGDYFEIVYTFHISSLTPMGREVWQSQPLAGSVPRRLARFQLLYPAGLELVLGTPAAVTTVAPEPIGAGFVRRVWRAENVPAVLDPTDGSMANLLPYLVDFTTVHDWNAVGKWYERQTHRQRPRSDLVEAKAREIVGGLTDEREKALALARFVTQRIAYSKPDFQVEPFRPTDPERVLRRGIGDCKDQCALLLAMARSVGVDGAMALVDTRVGRDYPYLPSTRFNHVVALLRTAQGPLWVDPTTGTFDPTHIPPPLQGAQVLLLAGDASRFERVPQESHEQTYLRLSTVVRLDASGYGVQTTRVEESAQIAAASLQAFAGLPPANWSERIASWFTPDAGTVRVTRSDVPDPQVLTDNLKYGFTAERSFALTPLGEGLVLGSPFQTAWSLARLPLENRKTSFDASGLRGVVRERIEIHLPDSLRAGQLPKPVQLECPEATYRLHVAAVDGNVLVLERELHIRPLEVPRERCEALRQFFAKVTAADRCLVVLSGSLQEPSRQSMSDVRAESQDAVPDR